MYRMQKYRDYHFNSKSYVSNDGVDRCERTGEVMSTRHCLAKFDVFKDLTNDEINLTLAEGFFFWLTASSIIVLALVI